VLVLVTLQVLAQFVSPSKKNLQLYILILFQLANLPNNELNVPSADELLSLVQSKLTTRKETGVEVRSENSFCSQIITFFYRMQKTFESAVYSPTSLWLSQKRMQMFVVLFFFLLHELEFSAFSYLICCRRFFLIYS